MLSAGEYCAVLCDDTIQAVEIVFISVVAVLSATVPVEVEVTPTAVLLRLFSLPACIVVARLRAPIHLIAFKQLAT
ncbi:unnamed protein product [Onchocerca flexuosa]|uniref:Secreted protein n=1 Tax=Onchocerca flexuosa TaxID=387005 RepID=A0A183H8E0_9BILA|nr:unnamed protein product [Onchocerca flexuosa]